MADKKNKQQLYYLVGTELHSRVSNADDLGFIVGHTIIRSLIDFSTPHGARAEYKDLSVNQRLQFMYDEMRAVYSGLQRTIESLKTYDKSAILDEYMKDDVLDSFLNGHKDIDTQVSLLFKEIAEKWKGSKDSKDKLRLFGSKLVEKVKRRKPVEGHHNSFTTDYADITTSYNNK